MTMPRSSTLAGLKRGSGMTLVLQCPVCSQGLVFRGPRPVQEAACPTCKAPLRIRNPQLAEHEILSIISGPGRAI